MATKSGDVRAGGAYVEVTAKDQLTRTMVALKARMMAFAGGMKAVGLSLAVPGAAAVLPALFKGLGRAEEVRALAEALGASVEMAQRLKFAMDATGMSVEDVLRRVGDPKIQALLDRAPVLPAAEIARQIDASREWKATLAELEIELQKLAQAFLPVLQAVAQFVAHNKGAVVTVTLFGVALWGFGMALKVVMASLAVLTTAMVAMKVAALALYAILSAPIALPLLAVGTALALIASRLAAQPDELKKSTSAWAGFGEQVGDTVSGIAAALGKGDIEGAWDLLVSSLQLTWQRFVYWLTDKWSDFKDAVLDGGRDIAAGLKVAFSGETLKGLASGKGVFGTVFDSVATGEGKKVVEERSATRDADRAARRADRDAALKELEDAKKAFEEAVKQARLPAAKKEEPKKEQAPPPKAVGEQDYAGLVAGVRGAFRRMGDGAMQFQDQRGLEVQKRQLGVQQQQLRELEKIGEGIQKIGQPRFQ